MIFFNSEPTFYHMGFGKGALCKRIQDAHFIKIYSWHDGHLYDSEKKHTHTHTLPEKNIKENNMEK